MVDIINLCQLYKQQKIIKVKWIYENYNLANSMTKNKPLLALKILIDTNCINISNIKLVE